MKTTVQADSDFSTLVRTHHAMVWRYLRLLGCESSLAEDLTQETFLTVFRRRPAEMSGAGIGIYLRRVARSRFVDLMRKRDRVVPVDLDQADDLWSEAMDSPVGSTWYDALDDCLQLVDGRPRQALDLKYRDQLSIRTVAQALGMKESGIKTMLGRVKQKLRECIERKVAADD